MAAFEKVFSDLVASDLSTVAAWQIGSRSPKVRFGSLANLLTNSSLMAALERKAAVQVPTLVPKPGSPLATFEVKRLGFLNLVP